MDWAKLLNSDRRRTTTNKGGDHRVEFERDWDRAIFSTPVKRLQDKTQVFPLDPNDAIRTRLTHSLEVSTVARGLAIRTCKWLMSKNEIDFLQSRSIEAIAATCGLVHDIGNPPFGHSGEDAIRYWFETRFPIKNNQFAQSDSDPLRHELCDEQLTSDFRLFEGNAQAFRLLTKLQILADFYGLNLTYGTLSASCKYLAPSHQINGQHDRKKPGFFKSEEDVVYDVRDRTGTGDARNPITFLVEAADDAVYSVADIEDAVRKGILKWSDVKAFLDEEKDPAIAEALQRADQILKVDNPEVPPRLPCDVYVSAFRTASIAVVVNACAEAFEENYNSIMMGKYHNELISDSRAKKLVVKLKELARQRAYATPPNLKLELMGRKVICDLMDVFWEGAKAMPREGNPQSKNFQGKAAALLSENYRKVFQYWLKEQKDLPEKYHRLLLVTDYVSGMTDTFAIKLHKELSNG